MDDDKTVSELHVPIVRQALAGARSTHLKAKPGFDAFMRAHPEYGNSMLQILELLRENNDQWEFRNGQLRIFDDPIVDLFNKRVDGLNRSKETIELTIGKIR